MVILKYHLFSRTTDVRREAVDLIRLLQENAHCDRLIWLSCIIGTLLKRPLI